MYLHNVAFVESPTLLHMQDKEEIAYCTHQTMRGTLGPVNWRQVRGQHQMQSRDSASNASSHETLSSSFERPKCQRLVITHPTQNAPRPTQHHGNSKTSYSVASYNVWTNMLSLSFSIMIYQFSVFWCIPQWDSMGLLSLYQIDTNPRVHARHSNGWPWITTPKWWRSDTRRKCRSSVYRHGEKRLMSTYYCNLLRTPFSSTKPTSSMWIHCYESHLE